MSAFAARTVVLPDETATLALGRALASGVRPGMQVQLRGDLGAGKTTLVRGLLRGLGYAGRVKSPTFSLVEPYELSSLSLYHFDFYRFEDGAELRDSGLLESFGGPAVCLVEWPERAGDALPAPDLDIALRPGPETGRTAVLTAHTDRGEVWLQAVIDRGKH